MSMKVMHILPTNKFSGAENVVCEIINTINNNKDFDYEMIYCSPDGDIKKSLQERNIPYLPINTFSLNEVKRAIKTYQPDIIHAHDIKASVLCAIAAGKIPIISHLHNNDDNMKIINGKTILYRLTINRYAAIIAVAASIVKDFAFKKSLRNAIVLRNVIDYDQIQKKVSSDSSEYSYHAVYVGRISYQKNPQRLIKVFSKVVKKNPNAKFAIIGDGPLRQEAERAAELEGIYDNVDFLGFQSNPLKIMSDAKVMVLTSRYEGTPMCALEAMALGLPIVSTPTDGLMDIIEDGCTGFLSDDDDVLAEKINEIMVNNELYQTLRKNAINRFAVINNYNEYINKLHQIYLQSGQKNAIAM